MTNCICAQIVEHPLQLLYHLQNATDLVIKTVIIDLAESGNAMRATHTCMKTYFMKNQSGEIIAVTIPALYVKSDHQDLLSIKACN